MRVMIAYTMTEGGKWILGSNNDAPIRLYSDGCIEDDIAFALTIEGVTRRRRRNRLSRADIKSIMSQAQYE